MHSTWDFAGVYEKHFNPFVLGRLMIGKKKEKKLNPELKI